MVQRRTDKGYQSLLVYIHFEFARRVAGDLCRTVAGHVFTPRRVYSYKYCKGDALHKQEAEEEEGEEGDGKTATNCKLETSE